MKKMDGWTKDFEDNGFCQIYFHPEEEFGGGFQGLGGFRLVQVEKKVERFNFFMSNLW